ncbi:hypothetical protein EB796_005197 [Bugula neritina]|uniref:Uncharacterized protein n=1 Tax=Bugula neritina TaxID=10212 RepID=A0A7J7KG84_BUGNE|nr:hypothetical protein EB796_005197 [Bugula neritina]
MCAFRKKIRISDYTLQVLAGTRLNIKDLQSVYMNLVNLNNSHTALKKYLNHFLFRSPLCLDQPYIYSYA